MPSLLTRSPAKLNLVFDITGSRPDGYHEVETIFQTVDLEDELEFNLSESSEFSTTIECTPAHAAKLMPLDESNLIGKSARKFFTELKSKQNYALSVKLRKIIPIGAGLAGGSGNAAATLLALNHFFDNIFSEDKLMAIAATIGSDVAFCLSGGSAIGKGRGELLTQISNKLDLTYCLVKPRTLSISTPWAYAAFDRQQPTKVSCSRLASSIQALESGNLELAFQSFGNVFEPVVFAEHPQLAQLKEELLASGAWYCQMTGSGPTLFAVVASLEMAQQIRRNILKDDELGFYYWTKEILDEALPPLDFHIARTCNHGVRIVAEKE